MTDSITNQMWEALAQSPIVMIGLNKNADHSEPMHVQLDKDADNCFWLYTKTDNRVAQGGKAMAQFVSKEHDIFACICGKLVEETDKDIIDKYWSRKVAAWYAEGRDDPSLVMLRFDLDSAEIWTQDPSLAGMLKLSTGGHVKPSELGDHTVTEFS